MTKTVLVLGTLCLALILAAQKPVYIWKDKKGVSHICDTKPEGVRDVKELRYETSRASSETAQQPEKDDFFRALEEEKAKKASEYEEKTRRDETQKAQAERERLRAEEERARELYNKSYSPFVRNYAVQKLQEVEKEKQRLNEQEGEGK